MLWCAVLTRCKAKSSQVSPSLDSILPPPRLYPSSGKIPRLASVEVQKSVSLASIWDSYSAPCDINRDFSCNCITVHLLHLPSQLPSSSQVLYLRALPSKPPVRKSPLRVHLLGNLIHKIRLTRFFTIWLQHNVRHKVDANGVPGVDWLVGCSGHMHKHEVS